MATPAYRSNTNTQSSNATTIALTKPTGVVSGDVLYAELMTFANEGTTTPPSGWSQISTRQVMTFNNTNVTWWRKVAGTSEPTSYTWTFTNAVSANGSVEAWYNVDTATPEDATASWNSGSAGNTNLTVPSVTPTVSGGVQMTLMANYIGTYGTTPTGWTQDWTDGGQSNGGGHRNATLTASTATGTTTWPVGGGDCCALSIALKPTGGSTTNTQTGTDALTAGDSETQLDQQSFANEALTAGDSQSQVDQQSFANETLTAGDSQAQVDQQSFANEALTAGDSQTQLDQQGFASEMATLTETLAAAAVLAAQTDALTAGDSVATASFPAITATDTLTPGDALTGPAAALTTQTDALTSTETLAAASLATAQTDALTPSESFANAGGPTASDSLTALDSPQLAAPQGAQTDALTPADTATGAAAMAAQTDAATPGDALTTASFPAISATDVLTPGDALTPSPQALLSGIDPLTLGETRAALAVAAAQTDALTVGDSLTLAPFTGGSLTLTDAVTVGDAPGTDAALLAAATDALTPTETLVGGGIASATTDALALAETVGATATQAAATDALTVGDALPLPGLAGYVAVDAPQLLDLLAAQAGYPAQTDSLVPGDTLTVLSVQGVVALTLTDATGGALADTLTAAMVSKRVGVALGGAAPVVALGPVLPAVVVLGRGGT